MSKTRTRKAAAAKPADQVETPLQARLIDRFARIAFAELEEAWKTDPLAHTKGIWAPEGE
jgi:hypothetical protein